MNVDGTGVKGQTDAPGASFDPLFSPDDKKIAFTTNGAGNPEIYVMDTNPATADAANRTNSDKAEFERSWQPLP